MGWGEVVKEFEGTWFNILKPFYGYLKIYPYKGEADGGEALAMIHSKHGYNEPPIWYRGVWRPTDMGYQVWCGPYHWKNIAIFATPDTKNPKMGQREYFRSEMNGWGWCNFGKLGTKEEQEYIDKLKGLPGWQEEPTFPKDYPNATWCESKKYVRPPHTFDSDVAQPQPHVPGTHVGGGQGPQPPEQPNASSQPDPAPHPPVPPAPGGGPPPPQYPDPNADPKPQPATPMPEAPIPPGNKPEQGGNPGEPGGPDALRGVTDAGQAAPVEAGRKDPEPLDNDPGPGNPADGGKGKFASAVDKATDKIDNATHGKTAAASEKVDNAAQHVEEATGKLFNRNKDDQK